MFFFFMTMIALESPALAIINLLAKLINFYLSL